MKVSLIPRSKSMGKKPEQKNECWNDKGYEGGIGGKRVAGLLGGDPRIRMYYNPSSTGTSRLPRIRQDELFYFTQLAIWSYNIKEATDFGNVKVLMAKTSLLSHYFITFEAFSTHGVAATFQTQILYFFPRPCPKIEIVFVRIRPSDSESDDFTENSQEDHPSDLVRKDTLYKQRLSQLIKTHTHDPQFKLPIYLSQFALVTYNKIDLLVNAAMHDIASLKLVKPMKHVVRGTTSFVTFEAPLCDDSKNVERFQTEISMPTLFPTTKIEFWNFRMKTN